MLLNQAALRIKIVIELIFVFHMHWIKIVNA